MNFWVIKSKPLEYDLENMLKLDEIDIWSTKKKIPIEMKSGDVLFIWAGDRTKKIIGVAEYNQITPDEQTEYNQFNVHYKSAYIDSDLDIESLRMDKILNKENKPSFLKQGAGGTIFPLTSQQGRRLSTLLDECIEVNILLEDIKEVDSFSNLNSTERETLVKSRIGQGKFRKDLINYWEGCSVTKYDNVELLLASHIKPWRDSTNKERLDVFNGLLLTPTLDKLFDKHYISFDREGKIILSNLINNFERLGIDSTMKIDITEKHEKYLAHHRSKLKRI